MIDSIINQCYIIREKLNEDSFFISWLGRAIFSATEFNIQFLKNKKNFYHLEDLNKFKSEFIQFLPLKHPCLVDYLEIDEFDDNTFITSSLSSGISLENLLKSGVNLPIKFLFQIILKLSEGLEIIHDHNLTYKCLNLENIWIKLDKESVNNISLSNFGLYHLRDYIDLNNTEQLINNYSYMSPEVKGIINDKITNKSDLYSLGVIFYRLLTGVLPFKELNKDKLTKSIIDTNYILEKMKILKINQDEINIIMKLLNNKPIDRYDNIKDFISDIKKLMINKGFSYTIEDFREYLGQDSINFEEKSNNLDDQINIENVPSFQISNSNKIFKNFDNIEKKENINNINQFEFIRKDGSYLVYDTNEYFQNYSYNNYSDGIEKIDKVINIIKEQNITDKIKDDDKTILGNYSKEYFENYTNKIEKIDKIIGEIKQENVSDNKDIINNFGKFSEKIDKINELIFEIKNDSKVKSDKGKNNLKSRYKKYNFYLKIIEKIINDLKNNVFQNDLDLNNKINEKLDNYSYEIKDMDKIITEVKKEIISGKSNANQKEIKSNKNYSKEYFDEYIKYWEQYLKKLEELKNIENNIIKEEKDKLIKISDSIIVDDNQHNIKNKVPVKMTNKLKSNEMAKKQILPFIDKMVINASNSIGNVCFIGGKDIDDKDILYDELNEFILVKKLSPIIVNCFSKMKKEQFSLISRLVVELNKYENKVKKDNQKIEKLNKFANDLLKLNPKLKNFLTNIQSEEIKDINGESFKDEFIDFLCNFNSNKEAFIIILNDIQYSDKQSIIIINELTQKIDHFPLIIFCFYDKSKVRKNSILNKIITPHFV